MVGNLYCESAVIFPSGKKFVITFCSFELQIAVVARILRLPLHVGSNMKSHGLTVITREGTMRDIWKRIFRGQPVGGFTLIMKQSKHKIEFRNHPRGAPIFVRRRQTLMKFPKGLPRWLLQTISLVQPRTMYLVVFHRYVFHRSGDSQILIWRWQPNQPRMS